MAILRAQVQFQGKSGKPEDVVVNTWHFDSASSDDAAVDVIRDQLVAFYNTATTGTPSGGPIAEHLSEWLSRTANASKIKVYDLADAKPRVARERSFTLGPSLTGPPTELPAEVALCVSFYAGQNRPRYRGRVYLGPFVTTANQEETTGGGQRSAPTASLVDRCAGALKRLIQDPLTQNLAVYSEMDNVARVVTNGWVDDAWDTIRSRGQAATRRVLVP